MVRAGLLWDLPPVRLLVVVLNIHLVKHLVLVRIMVIMGVHTIKIIILPLTVVSPIPSISLVVIINKG